MYASASGCDTAWYVPIFFPNCSRDDAYSSASSSARRATPQASRASAVWERASISGRTPASAEPAAGLAAPDDAERTGLVRRREDLPLRALELVDAVSADDRDPVRGVEIGDERAERERPARFAGCDLGALLGGKGGQRERDRREERTAVERPAELLEEHCLLDEGEPRTAVLLCDRDTRPAELGQLRPGGLGGRPEEFARLLA